MGSLTLRRRLSSGWALGSLCGLVLIIWATVAPEPSAAVGRLPDRTGSFEKQGWGLAAPVQDEWLIDLAGPEPMTVVTSAVRCDTDLYLVDSPGGVIHHVNLDAQRRVDIVGVAPDGTRILRLPHSAAADCDAHRLYVVDADGVNVFDTRSKQLEARFPHPELFSHTSLSGAVFNAQQGTLFVPGLWASRKYPWSVNGRDGMFVRTWIGYVLHLKNGSISAGFPAVDKGCWSWTWDCVSVAHDRGSDGVWAVAQRVGTDIGIFAEDRRLIRRIDARSDLFRRNGTRLPLSATAKQKFAWHHRNSVISRVFTFDGLVATIHLYHAAERPQKGVPFDFEVFMNVHRFDGTGIVSDVKLPGIPLFRDDRSLYVADHGPGGRRHIGFGPLRIVSVPVLGAEGGLHAALVDHKPANHPVNSAEIP